MGCSPWVCWANVSGEVGCLNSFDNWFKLRLILCFLEAGSTVCIDVEGPVYAAGMAFWSIFLSGSGVRLFSLDIIDLVMMMNQILMTKPS